MSPPSTSPPPVGLFARLQASVAQSRQTLGLVWRSSPKGTLGLGGLTVLAASLPPLVAYVGKLIVDAVVARDRARAVHMVVVELAAVGVMALLERSLGLVRQIVGSRLGIDVNVAILEKAATLELRHFEDSEFYDKLSRARREASLRPLSLIESNFLVLRNAMTLAGYIALLVHFSGHMVLALLAATMPAFIAEAKFSGAAFRLRNWRSPDTRRLQLPRIRDGQRRARQGGEAVRSRPDVAWSLSRLGRAFLCRRSPAGREAGGWGYALSLVSTAVFYGCYALIVATTVAGRLSLGDMTLYLVAFRQGQQSFQAILMAAGSMYEDTLYMSNLFEYLAIPTENRKRKTPAAVAVEEGIRFEGVGFQYPGAERWALRNINLFIPKGQSLALVGENGAGKTTFIKLLSGLYQPSEGRIRLDGRDLADWDRQALRRRIGVIFQDFNQYQLLLRENIAFGSVEHMRDDLRLARAVDQGGAREMVANLGEGLETQLGRWFKGGVDLSGGQWQKVALARAFMRDEADILILDEPTASLDVEAEHAVFQRFRALAHGRTTMLISHRFPTVRMADRIVVLEGGQVIEEGTHAELLAAGARYARLFALQAEGYR